MDNFVGKKKEERAATFRVQSIVLSPEENKSQQKKKTEIELDESIIRLSFRLSEFKIYIS